MSLESDLSQRENLTRDEWISKLNSSTRKQLKQLFRTLPVPEVKEFNGELQGFLLNQGNALTTSVTRFFINKEGEWLGKAFRATSDVHANGYNIFKTRKGILRCLRMQISKRHTDSGPVVTIDYAGINDGLIGGISDEVRRVAPGLFLGIGVVPLGGRLFPRLNGRVMFAMAGPVNDFQEEAAHCDFFRENETFTGVAA